MMFIWAWDGSISRVDEARYQIRSAGPSNVLTRRLRNAWASKAAVHVDQERCRDGLCND